MFSMLGLLCLPAAAQSAGQSTDATATEEAPPEAKKGPQTYALDPAKSWLYVVITNDTSAFMSRLGHDHAIRATTFTGSVTWDVNDPAACSVSISFPVTALSPDPPGMRERAGLSPDGAVGAGSLETIKDNFLAKSQLDSASFPKISYQSSSCDGTTGKVKVSGNLTIHGISHPVTLTMDIAADDATFAGAGSFTASHTNFGMKAFTNLGGALRNNDELKFVIDVKGTAKGG